jgi:hypothetical protein
MQDHTDYADTVSHLDDFIEGLQTEESMAIAGSEKAIRLHNAIKLLRAATILLEPLTCPEVEPHG